MTADKSELIIYQTDDGRVKLEVRLHDETVWLTQPMIAELKALNGELRDKTLPEIARYGIL